MGYSCFCVYVYINNHIINFSLRVYVYKNHQRDAASRPSTVWFSAAVPHQM